MVLSLSSCSNEDLGRDSPPAERLQSQVVSETRAESPGSKIQSEPTAWFGNLHVHCGWSYDTYLMGTPTTPDDAYRFARGEAIAHVSGNTMQINGPPLDFLAVTDHSEYLADLFKAKLGEIELPIDHVPLLRKIFRGSQAERDEAYFEIDLSLLNAPVEGLNDPTRMHSAWAEMVAAADRHYSPGTFTTFVGFEWTSTPRLLNLHRNVIFRSNRVPRLPFTSFDSMRPQDLWAWMDAQRKRGVTLMAIPHNSNLSGGAMFPEVDSRGVDINADWANARLRNEPLVEITQAKGTSETHPILSPTDEMADFELIDKSWAEMYTPDDVVDNSDDPQQKFRGSYVRSAYKTGLILNAENGFNPYQFGVIGSTDTHNGGGSFQENNYMGAHGLDDADPEVRLKSAPRAGMASVERSASGLVGVWALENTREAIFDALARKETFATSGTRIQVRLVATYDKPSEAGNTNSTLMGGELDPAPAGQTPNFLVTASKDPDSAGLDRIQIIKGWVRNGRAHERVFDIACSNQRQPDPENWHCTAQSVAPDPANCDYLVDEGQVSFKVAWQDPTFSPEEYAFYYVRVIENPTCRWSTLDALRTGSRPDSRVPAVIQERAWSSPIWYRPTSL